VSCYDKDDLGADNTLRREFREKPMMYGNFQFSLKTLSANSLTRSMEFKWVDTDRVGDLPYVQNLGIAKDNVEIAGVFYPKLNAATQYNSVDKMAVGIATETA
jgi:phage protein U